MMFYLALDHTGKHQRGLTHPTLCSQMFPAVCTLCPTICVGDLMSLLVSTPEQDAPCNEGCILLLFIPPGLITVPEPIKPGHAMGSWASNLTSQNLFVYL